MYTCLYWKIKFLYLFTLVDTEGREIQTQLSNESACFDHKIQDINVVCPWTTSLAQQNFQYELFYFQFFFLCREFGTFPLLHNFL